MMTRSHSLRLLAGIGVLASLAACSDPTPSRPVRSTAVAPQPVASDMVRQVQDRLQRDGYYKAGLVDGIWGSGTMTAVQTFQRDHSLNPTGQLDMPTLQALNVTAPAYTAPTSPVAANPATGTSDTRLYDTNPSTGPTGATAASR